MSSQLDIYKKSYAQSYCLTKFLFNKYGENYFSHKIVPSLDEILNECPNKFKNYYIIKNRYSIRNDEELYTFHWNIENNLEELSFKENTEEFIQLDRCNQIFKIESCYEKDADGTKVFNFSKLYERFNSAQLFLKNFPTNILKKEEITRITEQFLYLKDRNCDRCLEDFKIGENVIKLKCKHIFHKECLKDWLIAGNNNNCPYCQYKLKDELLKIKLNLTIEEFNVNGVTLINDQLHYLKVEECSLCLGNYKIGENVMLLDCKHIFHAGCLKKW
uniref:RING-type domain-containing protein n=1 Tax=Meloidogyne enterolobii TaxID=390850 RepID=A0A6V7VQJ5_MELEN|nr:unnamed protein product [Meloidogyne enterolobii]